MPKAMWNGTLIADATDDQVEIVENNIYFPMEAVQQKYLKPSATESLCPWKGTAGYFDVSINGAVNKDAAWIYRSPNAKAQSIAGRVAFWKGVEVTR